MPLIRIFIIIFFFVYSTAGNGETLLLKCESKKHFGDEWIGNIKFVKIDFETKQVLMKEVEDPQIGWIIHELTSINEHSLIIKQCNGGGVNKCPLSQNFYTLIDRATGLKKYIATEEQFVLHEYQCRKSERLF